MRSITTPTTAPDRDGHAGSELGRRGDVGTRLVAMARAAAAMHLAESARRSLRPERIEAAILRPAREVDA